MIEISTAVDVPDEALRVTMERAFSDYAVPLHLDAASFAFMMRQRGLDRDSSRVAIQGGQVVAIWLTAVRGGNAYLISSGTQPEYRAQGIARALAHDCINGLRARGVRSFQTEVLQSNKSAAQLYYSLGMEVSRELACFSAPPAAEKPSKFQIQSVSWREIAPSVLELRDWPPSWQNDDISISAIEDRVSCLAAHDTGGLSGFVVAEPKSGTVFQMAVRTDMRRQGLGTDLIRAASKPCGSNRLRFINVQGSDNGFRRFMSAQGAEETEGQFELTIQL